MVCNAQYILQNNYFQQLFSINEIVPLELLQIHVDKIVQNKLILKNLHIKYSLNDKT